jgi:tRNA threonylcarbamoyl adenosine modification protein (Sua5/YciO/YrdC/YwlC family)
VLRLRVRGHEADTRAVEQAVRILRQGGIVAFPTDTVYGLCVDAGNPEAVERLYAAKGRQASRACAYLLADRQAADPLVQDLPPLARRLADHFWPGPVTLVVPGPDGRAVGLRLPDDELARGLAAAAGRPLLQTSANRSGEPPALNAAGVAQALGDAVALVLDGGRTPGGRSSTVVRCDARTFAVRRKGAVTEADIIRAATDLTLVACTGNLCRSPMAEAMLRHACAEQLACREKAVVRHGHRFGSFGITALAGRPATDHSITVAEEYGLDLRRHRSRPFALRMVQEARRVYCLSRTHLNFLAPYFQDRPDDLDLLDPKGKEIHDPYGSSLKVYRKVGAQVLRAAEKRAAELVGEAPAAT